MARWAQYELSCSLNIKRAVLTYPRRYCNSVRCCCAPENAFRFRQFSARVIGRYTREEFICITCTFVVVHCLVPIFCEAKFCGVMWTGNDGGARLMDSSENCPLSF